MLLLFAVCLTGLTLVAAGCGGSDNESASGDTATLTTTTEETTTEETTTEETTTEAESTTESTETTEESTDTSGTPSFATAENCKEFSDFGARISAAFSGTGDQDLQGVADQLDQLASAAPDEIKSDFQTMADGYKQIADALEGVDLTSTNPDPQALAKLSQLGTEWSTKMTTAAQNVANWAATNCTG